MALAAVLFDLDGVLVDSRTPIAGSLNHALVRQGLAPRAEAELHGFIGAPLAAVFRELLADLGAEPARVAACIAAYRECYGPASLRETRAFEGVAELLARLAGRWPLAVATSKPAEYARPILETLGLAGAMRAIVGPPLGPGDEPKAVTVARALRALGLAPGAHAVMVGDRHHDVVAGRAHGLVTVGATWGIGGEAELREAGVDHLVHAPTDLDALLDRIAASAA